MTDRIELRGVCLEFQGKPVLRDITLTLAERRIGIIGRNGSGKTSLMKVIAGLTAATGGEVRVGGTDPMRDRRAMLRRIGILFQSPDTQIIFPTVIEELAFGLTQMGMKKPEAQARVRALLAQEGRAHWQDALVARLSQGQKQWLCLMAVVLMAPDTLLCDEPFAALDLPTRMRLRRQLDRLPQRVITVSHDPASLTDHDRIIWIEDGAVRGDGPPAQLLPEFIAAMTEIGGRDADLDLAD